MCRADLQSRQTLEEKAGDSQYSTDERITYTSSYARISPYVKADSIPSTGTRRARSELAKTRKCHQL